MTLFTQKLLNFKHMDKHACLSQVYISCSYDPIPDDDEETHHQVPPSTLQFLFFFTTGHHGLRNSNTGPCVVPTPTHLSKKCDVSSSPAHRESPARETPPPQPPPPSRVRKGNWIKLNMYHHISPLRTNNKTLGLHTLSSPSALRRTRQADL